ncbi:Amuc_1100 family pilus-like protein [Prosthecobacter sp. SYSU 5D2]|uniref:Amuc_1100 family pilus-like protein n=1 Tax=Prosthecobacter sp. SYSU 5D2 TaxID=3134134 RepID=UPI0031FE5353
MSWIQQNKLPAAILGVSAAGAAGLGFMLFSAYSSYTTSLEQFDATNASLASLKSATLPPSPENLAIKQGLVKEFTDEAGRLSLVLNTMQSETQAKPTTDTEFQAKLKTKIADSRKYAADRRMGLPATYNLTFDRYTAELPKSNEVATDLSGYLDAVDAIVNAFANAGVRQVEMLERSELDSEKSEVQPTTRGAAKKGPARPAVAAPKLTERRQVRAILTLDQAALQLLMSNLASPSEMAYFTVVRQLRIENERQEGPLRSEVFIPVATTGEVDENGVPIPVPVVPAVEGTPAQAVATVAAPVDAVAVLGNERLRVFLEIDLVYFLNAQTASAATR